MDAELINWLNLVWGALDEEEPAKREHLLNNANSFLEQTRQVAGVTSEVPAA
jgi:hypothetical protein